MNNTRSKKGHRKIISLILALSCILTVVSCNAVPGKKADHQFELEYTEFPTKPYDADIVHPVRKTGTVTGQEAVSELNDIEWDYIRHEIGDDYLNACWTFNDLEKAGIVIDKPALGKVGNGDIKGECSYLTGLLERLYKIDFESLDKQDRDFYEHIVFNIEEERYIKQYEGFCYLVPAVKASIVGSFYLTVSYVHVRNKAEADKYIELLKDVDRYYDEVCVFEEIRSQKGYASIPEFYKKSSNAYYMLTQESQTVPFRDDFIEKLNAIEGITEDEINAYAVEFDKVMEDVVIPEFLECCKRIAALEGTNTNDRGLAGFEHGKEYYEHLLRKQIGRDCNIEELSEGMDEILSMKTDTSGKPVIEGNTNQELLDNISDKAWEYFPELDIDYEIIKLPEMFKTAGITGVYAARSFDDPSHEVIFLPETSRSKQVVFHEGIPGHMYQFNYHKKNLRHIGMFAFVNNVYVEGWATYIMENPAGMYGDSSEGIFKYNGPVFRNYVTQARADILINYEGLSGMEAAEYLEGLSDELPTINSGDLTTMPGIGINYGLGCYMTLKTLESIRNLDPEMDIKTMHKLYLDAGPGCFDRILESAVREYESMNK